MITMETVHRVTDNERNSAVDLDHNHVLEEKGLSTSSSKSLLVTAGIVRSLMSVSENLAVDFDHNFDGEKINFFDLVSCPGFGT
jgi:hypothetical protein